MILKSRVLPGEEEGTLIVPNDAAVSRDGAPDASRDRQGREKQHRFLTGRTPEGRNFSRNQIILAAHQSIQLARGRGPEFLPRLLESLGIAANLSGYNLEESSLFVYPVTPGFCDLG